MASRTFAPRCLTDWLWHISEEYTSVSEREFERKIIEEINVHSVRAWVLSSLETKFKIWCKASQLYRLWLLLCCLTPHFRSNQRLLTNCSFNVYVYIYSLSLTITSLHRWFMLWHVWQHIGDCLWTWNYYYFSFSLDKNTDLKITEHLSYIR